jgi:hypothetical protein
MITFQNYVYTVFHKGTMCPLGTYQNFKKAYERVEDCICGATIVDCTDDNFDDKIKLEIYRNGLYVGEYFIVRCLLNIHSEEPLISTEMICDIQKDNKKRNQPKYRLSSEVM